jgi:hypothetical protein
MPLRLNGRLEIFYWLPNIEVLEPTWLKDKVMNALQNYLTIVHTAECEQEPG